MIPRRALTLLVSFLAIGWGLSGCGSSPGQMGTMDESHQKLTAGIYRPDGAPAARASISVYLVSDTSGTPVFQGFADDEGVVALPKLPDGVYRLVARDGALVAVQDSLRTVQGVLPRTPVTLDRAHKLIGRVRMASGKTPTSVSVRVVGFDSRGTPDVDGGFSLDGFSAGSYAVLFSPSDPGDSSVTIFVSFGAPGASPDSLVLSNPVVVPVRGVPALSGFRVAYPSDIYSRLVLWDPPVFPGFQDVVVRFRADINFGVPLILAETAGDTAILQRLWQGDMVHYTAQARAVDGRLGPLVEDSGLYQPAMPSRTSGTLAYERGYRVGASFLATPPTWTVADSVTVWFRFSSAAALPVKAVWTLYSDSRKPRVDSTISTADTTMLLPFGKWPAGSRQKLEYYICDANDFCKRDTLWFGLP